MADFFKYLWHCIWESFGYLTGYAPDLPWKDFWVAMSIILLFMAIEFLVLLKVRVFRSYQSTQDNSTEDKQNDDIIYIHDPIPQDSKEEEKKSDTLATTNQIKMFQYSVYIVFLGVIMLCLLIAIILMALLFNKPLAMSDLAMLTIYCAIFIVITIIMVMAISRYIIVDSKGIKVTSFNTGLISIQWNEIASIEVDSYLKIPMYKIILFDGKSVSFIQRNKLKSAIITYGNEEIQQIINDINCRDKTNASRPSQDNTLSNEHNSEVVSDKNYTKENKIRMLKNSVYMLVLGGIMICLLIAIILMMLSFDKPFVAGGLAMLILFWTLFIMLIIVMIMMLVQYIIIDSNGIKVTCFNKTLTSIRWNEIANIEVEYQFKIPMYKVILVNENSISFIQRKKLKLAIMTYGTEKIQQMINDLN